MSWNVSTKRTDAMTDPIPSTPTTQGCTKPPTPKLETTDDDMVRITVGDQVGWVSSYHLADQKIKQLQKAWLLYHTPNE